MSYAKRLRNDYIKLKNEPIPYISAEPLPSDLLEWHYVLQGPKGSDYEGGFYYGRLVFTADFPFKPPAIYMVTPNGRFLTNTRLCLSISDFHPESWNPSWSVANILYGTLSFMLEESVHLGSIASNKENRKRLALESHAYNLERCDQYGELFPEHAAKSRAIVEKQAESKRAQYVDDVVEEEEDEEATEEDDNNDENTKQHSLSRYLSDVASRIPLLSSFTSKSKRKTSRKSKILRTKKVRALVWLEKVMPSHKEVAAEEKQDKQTAREAAPHTHAVNASLASRCWRWFVCTILAIAHLFGLANSSRRSHSASTTALNANLLTFLKRLAILLVPLGLLFIFSLLVYHDCVQNGFC